MISTLWALALWGVAQAGPTDAPEPTPASVITAPQSSEVAVAAARLETAARERASGDAPRDLVDGQAHLVSLAGLLVAGPELATRDAGLAIRALCAWADTSGDAGALSVAIATAEWALSDRQVDGSGYSRHGDATAPAALADSVRMGQALQSLHGSTGDPVWLTEALATAGFIGSRFLSGGRGFASTSSLSAERVVLRDENADAVAFVAWLGHVTGDPRWSGMARHGLAWLRSQPDTDGATARAVRITEERPVHVVVVGPRGDAATQALFNAARALPGEHRWLEWRDPQVWVAAPSAVQVPLQGPPTAWLCDGLDCGDPLRTPSQVAGLRAASEETPVAEGEGAEATAP